MTPALLLSALILGIVEGLTEFLPVSSTGHLIVVADLLRFNGPSANTFEIFIQLGAILGVMWHYRARIGETLARPSKPQNRRLIVNLAIAFVPAAVVGLLLHHAIKTYLFNPLTVAGALIVGGVLILIVERLPLRGDVDDIDRMDWRHALKVGVAQTLALFPGVSRAGATIMGGLLFGLSRKAATEFSFFLAMPTMLAATFYDLYKDLNVLSPADVPVFAVGFVTAFIVALAVVRFMLIYIQRHDFTAFAFYRILLGIVVLVYFW